MPPKTKQGKKEEALESLEGLPKAFPFLVQLHYNVNTPPIKELLKQQIEGQPDSRCRFVGRNDIVEYGKEKGLITEEEETEKLSPEKLAKSAAAKMYELLAAAMKEKAVRYKEIKDKAIADYLAAQKPKEEEAKGKGAKPAPAKPGKKEELPQIDVPVQYPSDAVDLFVILKDFPMNEAEAAAFAQERYALNAVVCIKEGKPVEPPKVEPKVEEGAAGEGAGEEKKEDKKEEKKEEKKEGKKEGKKEEKGGKKEGKKEEKGGAKPEAKKAEELPKGEPTEEEKKKQLDDEVALKAEIKSSAELIDLLEKLAKKSARDSPLRDSLKLDIEFSPNPADPSAAAASFQTTLLQTLTEIGGHYIGFFKYIQGAALRPLCKVPADVQFVPPAEEVKKEEKKEEVKKEEVKKEEKGKKEDKKAAGKTDKKDANKPVEEIKVYDTEAVYPYKRPKHLNSLDDMPSVWHLYFYSKNMEKLNLEARTVGSIIVCLLQQIGVSKQEQIPPKPTEAHELMQLFAKKKEQLFNEQIASHEAKAETDPQAKAVADAKVIVDANVKSPYHTIYDDSDFVRMQYHGEKVFNESVSLSDCEMGILSNMLYPGKNRYMMEPIPTKPEAVRGAMRSEMHPFSTLPIYEFERALVIREFEKMFAKKTPQGIWNFGERRYEEKFAKEALCEIFSGALLFNPDVLTSYYILDDSLLVGLYYQSPPGRILHKQWRPKFQHLPDFPNYFHVFAKDSTAPSSLLDLDDGKVGAVEEREKFMYPSDNSVIRVTKKRIAGEVYPAVHVFKDGYTFGLRTDPTRPGQDGPCECWLLFENGTKLKVNMQSQRGVEDASSLGAVATITFASGLVVKFTGTGDVVQMRTENICKQKVEDESGAAGGKDKGGVCGEMHRVITGKGTVIKYMENGSIDVLMANGNTSEYKDGLWVGVNSRGKRRGRKPNEFEMEAINSATKTDPETLSRVTLRQDGVVMVKYKDGRLYTKHKDETTMLTSPNSQNVIVEKEGYAPIKVRIDPVKVRSNTVISRGGTDALLGADDIMVRSNDGRVVETFLPDGTFVETFKEKQQLEGPDNFSNNFVHLIRRPDGGVIKVKQDGEVVIMTAEQRVALNERGQKKELGKDVDYFYELFGVPTERKSGVYTVRCAQGKMFTIDEEGNKFYIYANGVTRERIAVSFNLDNVQEEEPAIPPEPVFQGPSYIDEQAKFLPAPKTIREPRLFVIKNDGSGSEWLSEKQLANYFRNKQRELQEAVGKAGLGPSTRKFEMDKLAGMENSKSLSFLTKSFRERDRLEGLSFIRGIEMPRIINTLQQSVVLQKEPPKQVFGYRCILEHPEFDQKKREIFDKDIERYQQWKEKQFKTRQAFGIVDGRTPEEIKAEKDIQVMILNHRKEKEKAVKQEEIKGKAIQEDAKAESDEADEAAENQEAEKEADEAEKALDQGNSKGSQMQPQKNEQDKKKPTGESAPSALGALKSSEGAMAASMKSRGSDAMTGTISQMSCGGEFVANYFYTKKGMEVKYEPIPEEKLKELMEKARKSRMKNQGKEVKAEEPGKEAKVADNQNSNPIVALEPEANADINKRTTPSKSKIITPLKPSHYQQLMQRMKEIEGKEQEDAENYHISKTKDFTVYGVTRTQKPFVSTLCRPKPPAEINEQFISIDAITDRRIKTTSMANRGYFNAPPVQTIRKQGQHQMIAKALQKKQTFEELMAETNSMINYNLTDPSRRNFVVLPPVVRFGKLRAGTAYLTEICCKNEDVMPQRFSIKQPRGSYLYVTNKNPGPVAQGMKAVLQVEISTTDSNSLGKIQDEFQLITKAEVYKIAVFARVLKQEEFDSLQAESFKLQNRPLLLPTVHEKGKEPLKVPVMEGSLGKMGATEGNETSLSVKAPKPNIGDDTEVVLDPSKKIEELLGKDKQKPEEEQY